MLMLTKQKVSSLMTFQQYKNIMKEGSEKYKFKVSSFDFGY